MTLLHVDELSYEDGDDAESSKTVLSLTFSFFFPKMFQTQLNIFMQVIEETEIDDYEPLSAFIAKLKDKKKKKTKEDPCLRSGRRIAENPSWILSSLMCEPFLFCCCIDICVPRNHILEHISFLDQEIKFVTHVFIKNNN